MSRFAGNLALGSDATVLSTGGSIAVGDNAQVLTNVCGIAIGEDSLCECDYGTALGPGAIAKDRKVVFTGTDVTYVYFLGCLLLHRRDQWTDERLEFLMEYGIDLTRPNPE